MEPIYKMQFFSGVNAKSQKIYYFTLPFREMLNSNLPVLEEVEKFHVQHRKKSYYQNGDVVANSNNIVFEHDPHNKIIESIFHLKAVVDGRKITDANEFIKALDSSVATKYACTVMTNVSDKVNDVSKHTTTRVGKASAMKYMGFKPHNYRDLFRMATCIRMVLPICSHFVVVNGVDDKSGFLEKCYRLFFKKVTAGDLYAKLQLYGYSIIMSSKNQNKPMHERLDFEGDTVPASATESTQRIIVDILHIIDPSMDAVAFIYNVIKNQAVLKARSRFLAEYYFVNKQTETGSIGRKVVAMYNEDTKILYQTHAKEVVVDHLWDKFVTKAPKKDQVKYEMKFLRAFKIHRDSNSYPTKVHDFIMVTSFFKYFGGSKGVMNAGSRENYVRMAIIFGILAERNGYPILGKLAICDKRPDRNKRVKPIEVQTFLETNTSITKILENKFGFMDESKILYRNITEIITSQWNDPTNREGEFSVALEDLKDEIISLLKSL